MKRHGMIYLAGNGYDDESMKAFEDKNDCIDYCKGYDYGWTKIPFSYNDLLENNGPEWIPITQLPKEPCDLLFRNDNQKGMARFYSGRWDPENGFFSRSGYTDQTHYQFIKL